MALAELQRSAKEYKIGKTVYTIVVLTAPYKVLDKMGNVVKNEVLITELNPRNLKGDVIQLYGHKLIFLNIYYKDDETPQPLRDWMDLIRESINNPDNPNINLEKVGIQRANFLIDIDNLTPREREERKLSERAKVTQKIYEEAATAKGLAKGLEKGLAEGLAQGLAEGAKKTKDDNILKALKRGKLSVAEIAEDNDVTVEYVLTIQKN
jgi:hypothetical protein